jgi:hypothetical protein
LGYAQTAIDLSNTKISSVCPPNNGSAGGPTASYANYPFAELCPTYVLYAWSSGAVDTNRHRLIILGGGHSDYHGDEAYALNYAASPPTLSRITDPDPWCNIGEPGNTDTSYCGSSGLGIGNSTCSATAPKDCFQNENNTPVAHHIFGCMAYLPTQDAIFNFEGTYPSGNDRGYTWWLQFSGDGTLGNNRWVSKDPVNGFNPLSISASSSGAMCVYDPLDDTVIVEEIAGSPAGYLMKYAPATNTYTLLNAYSGVPAAGIMAAFDPLHNKLWWMGGNATLTAFQAGYIDMSGAGGYSYVDQTSTLSSTCSGMWAPGTAWPGFEWNPLTSKFVGYPSQGNTVYIFDPVALSCSAVTLAGYTIPAVPPASTPSGLWGKFRYTPDNPGNFVYVGGGGGTSDAVQINLQPTNPLPTGLGKSTITCLDKDGDGYGVGPGCLGPDADDNDSSIQTGVQAIAKWGTLAAFLSHRGYNPTHIWYMAPATASANCQSSIGSCVGNDSTGVEDDINHPFLTWHAIQARVAAGHMVMMRDAWTDYVYNPPSGTAGSPLIYLGFPGEAPYLNPSVVANSQINILDVSWIVIDGVRAVQTGCWNGGDSSNTGIGPTTFHDNIFRNLECVAGGGSGSGLGGFAAFNGLVNITIEDSVFHDSGTGCPACQHEIYIGSHKLPSSNVVIQRNILYNSNGYPAFQFNGRVTNLTVQQNLVYNSPQSACYSWMEAVSNSFFQNNLCFNSAEGFQIVNYDGDCYIGSGSSGICPYNQSGNVIENNTLYVGSVDSSNTATVQPGLIVENLSTGCPAAWTALNPNYATGYKVIDTIGHMQLATTGGTSGSSTPSWNDSGGSTTDGTVIWSDLGMCVKTKVGNLGGNIYRNNIFVNSNGGTSNYSSVLFPMCTIASELSGLCVLDTAETTLATSTFTDNVFWGTGGGSSGAIGTGPNPGFGYTSHSCSALTSLSTISGCINSDPKFVSADPSAYYSIPASFNFALQPGSPALAAGAAAGAPTVDLWGSTRANPPAIGAYEPPGLPGGNGVVVSALSCAPISLASGGTATCTVTLGQAAGAGGAVVAISSSSQALTVPTTVSVAANASTATFTATAGTISSGQIVVVSATLNGGSQSDAITLVVPMVLSSLSCSPASLASGATSTCTVTVAQPGGAGGAVVSLASNSSALSVPATLSIPAGATTATFTATAGTISSGQTAVVTATLNGSSQTASLTLTMLTQVSSLSCIPASLASGAMSTCTVTLTQSAGVGGATVALASSTPTLTVPASILVAAGNSTANFSANAGTIAAASSAVLTATLNGASSTASITLTTSGGSSPLAWLQLSNTMLTNVCPANNFDGIPYAFATYCVNVVNSSSGGIADTNRNRLIIWGGGGGNYAGNEIYALNLTATPPSMTRLTNPSAWNYSVSYEANPDGTPTSRQTYNGLVYLPVQDALFSFGGGLPSGTSTNHTWIFTFADNTWHAQDPVNGFNPTTIENSSVGAACAYDPNTQTVFCIDGNTNYLLQYNPATNTYAKLSINAAYALAATPAIDPVHKLMVFMGNAADGVTFKVNAIDISGNDPNYTVQDWTSQVTGCAGMDAKWPGFVYDSAMAKFVGYPNQGSTVYIFDPSAKTCVAQTFANGPQTAVGTNGTFGRFQYFPSLYSSVLVNAANQNAYSLLVTSSACDLNGDGIVNGLDVQIALNQALGINVCSTTDLQGNGQCNVIDVQRVIDAALGGACIVGP